MSEAEGRDLDIATAKAMGWTSIWNEDHAAEGINPDGVGGYVPFYAQSEEFVGEMLTWAAAQGYSVSLMNYPADELYPDIDRWQATLTKRGRPLGPTDAMTGGDRSRMGASPQEALARAIVAAAGKDGCP